MPTSITPNPNATSNLNYWSKGGSSTTLTATSEGARWVGGASGTGRYLKIQAPLNSTAYTNYSISNWQVRRNSGTAQISKVYLNGIFWYDYGSGHGSVGGTVEDTRVASVLIPTGQFVVFPASLGGLASGNIASYTPWSGAPAAERDSYFDIYIYAEDNKAFDFTIKNVYLYRTDDLPTQPALDSNDATFSIAPTGDTLTAIGTWNKLPNEPVSSLKWEWGDGSPAETGAAMSSSYQTRSHTYPAAGIYTAKLTAIGYGAGSAYTTQTVTVPSGTFQAAFTHQVNYPDLLVDASPSVTPSLSPVQTYAWNWGDGTTGTGKTATHTYAEPGSYNVTLTISNATVARSSSVTKSIVITAPELPTTAPQFAMGLFLDDPASVTGATTLQAEMVPIVTGDTLRWNWTRNEVPTMSFQAPSNWLDRAIPGLTLETLKSDLVIRLNYGGGWVEPPMARFVIDTIRQDPLNPQQLVTVNCIGIAADDLAGIFFTPEITGDAYTAAEKAAGYSRFYGSSNAGAIVWDLLPVATTPGTGAPYLNFLNVDFSATVDSKGAAWSKTIESLSVPPDTSGLDLMQSLIDLGAADWYCQKNLLRMFNPRTSGKRSDTDAVPELLPGRDIKAAPQERNPVRSNCWGAVVVGDKKVPYTVSDTVSSNESYQRAAYRGRRFVTVQASDAASTDAALAAAKPSLESIYRSKDGEMVRELRFYENMPWMPYRDYHVADYVLAPGPDGKLVVVSVESITLQQDSSRGLQGSLILGNAFSVNSLQKKVASLAGGAGASVGQVKTGVGDTGWVDCEIKSGHTPQAGFMPQVRRIGSAVYFRGGLTSTGITASGVFAGVVIIPSGFRPTTSPPIYRGGTSSATAECGVYINTNGTVDLRTNATLSSYYMFAGPPWFVD